MQIRSRKGDGSHLWISCLRRQRRSQAAGTPSPAPHHRAPLRRGAIWGPRAAPPTNLQPGAGGQWSESPSSGWLLAKPPMGPVGPGPIISPPQPPPRSFPGSPRAGPSGRGGPGPPPAPRRLAPALFPFAKALLLRHRRETLPQQLPAPQGGGCWKERGAGIKKKKLNLKKWGAKGWAVLRALCLLLIHGLEQAWHRAPAAPWGHGAGSQAGMSPYPPPPSPIGEGWQHLC